MDREKMVHDLALAFSVSQQDVNETYPQEQLSKMLEDYCLAYGYFQNVADEFIEELVRRGE